MTELNDKQRGLIYGQAIGDALGLAAEFMSRQEVRQNYPQGIRNYDDKISDRQRNLYHSGEWTDDTNMMLCAMRATDGSIDQMATAAKFCQWKDEDGRDIGRQTLQVLSMPQYGLYPTQAAEAFWRRGGCEAAGNGGLMRTSLLSVWYDGESCNYLAQQSEKLCKLTHSDPRCVGSCVVVNQLLWTLLKGSSVSRAELLSLGALYDERIAEYINLGFDNKNIEALDLDNQTTMGYTLKTMAAGLWALNYGGSFESGLRTVIEQGGDADTNGAVAGAILGAKYGFESIPNEWRDQLYNKELLETFVANK